MEFLKELFYENLPIGDNTEEIDKYFSCLDKLISTKDNVQLDREEFPPSDSTVCGERDYRYYSADKFKELASRYKQSIIGQDVGHTESKQTNVSAIENYATESQDMEHIQEYSLFGGPDHTDPDDQYLSGKLDARDTGELPLK